MIATFGSLRRAFACGIFATATISLGGCFQVEEVADQANAGDAAADAEPGEHGEPELSIAMGDDAGPLDLNVDATVGQVTPADFARSSFDSKQATTDAVPDAPTLFAPASPAPASSASSSPAAPTTPAPPTSFAEAPALVAEPGDFAPSAPSPAALAPAAPMPQDFAQPSTPPVGEAFEPAAESAEFDPSGAQPTELAALPDAERGAPVEPMHDPETTVASPEPATETIADEEDAPAASALAETSETPAPAGPDEALVDTVPAASPETIAGAELLPANETPAEEAIADPTAGALAETEPAPTTDSEEPASEAEALTHPGFAPPALAVDPTEPAAPETEATAATPAAEPETSAAPESVATTPFEEEEFAPLFGPGRRLADASTGPSAPATIPTSGPALDPKTIESQTPSVLAQEGPSPAAEALAMQIIDPSAPPPASLRPTAQPNATLPAFDPTIGDRLDPPVRIDEEDYTPAPPGAATPGGERPGPAASGPTSPAPRELPMPGPARDDATEGPVPAPPATRTLPGGEPTPRASTTAEIADAARDWTDASGSHTLKAAILEYDKGEVRLETPKGERFRVSLSSLSRYDQGYVKGLAEGTLGKDAPERTWTDSSGEFSLEGKFVETSGDVVRLAREDGKTFRIPKRELASYDRGYVDGLGDAVKQ